MVLKIYSILRFLTTIFLLGALSWFGLSRFEQFQAEMQSNLIAADEFIQTIKDGQLHLEKYRLFGQLVQLTAIKGYTATAEKKLKEFAPQSLRSKTKATNRGVSTLVDNLDQSIKSQKAMLTTLDSLHQEEDLPVTAISTIGNLRIELEKMVGLALALQKSELNQIEVRKMLVLSQLKSAFIKVLAIILLLYIVELVLIFLSGRRTKRQKTIEKTVAQPAGMVTNITAPEPAPPITQVMGFNDRDRLLFQQNFRKIEESVEDTGERISLMAFNALLEAARAGENGKGFQIVAEELKRLADRSLKSANEVKNILEEISNNISNVESNKN